MAIDPGISLDAKTPPPAQMGLDVVGDFARVQNELNQAKLFNQSFTARQTAGQIVASAPDVDSAIGALQKNPLTSAFAPEIAQNLAATQSTLTSYQGAQQTQAQDGLQAFVKSLPAVMSDPSQWGATVASNLATLSPAARERVAPAMEAIRQGLTDGLPDDPDQAKIAFNKRLSGILIASGIGAAGINGILGTPETQNVGNKTLFGTRAPVQGTPEGAPGSSFTPAGGNATNELTMGLPPSIQNIPNTKGGATQAIVKDTGGGAITPLGQTPTTAQAGENQAQAASAVDLTKEANAITAAIPMRIKALDTIEDTMKQFQTGGGAPTRAKIGSMMQALKNAGFGISQQVIDKVANGSLSSAQLFETQLKPLLTNMLTHDAAGQGRVMLPEVEAYIHLIDTAKDPNAIIGAMNNIRRGYRIGFDKANKWQEYQKTGGDPGGFNTWYDDQFDESKLPTHAGALRLSPTNPADVLGGTGTSHPADVQKLLDKYLNKGGAK